MTDYLAKAREICPQEMLYDPLRGGLENAEGKGYNQAISLCLPIVADLLKRVDELEKEDNRLRTMGQEDEQRANHYQLALEEIATGKYCELHQCGIIAQKSLEGKR